MIKRVIIVINSPANIITPTYTSMTASQPGEYTKLISIKQISISLGDIFTPKYW